MLYINIIAGEKTWHVGSGPVRDIVHPDNVISIQADGDELDLICERFGVAAIRPRGSNVVRWYGDTAKFIVGNLD